MVVTSMDAMDVCEMAVFDAMLLSMMRASHCIGW